MKIFKKLSRFLVVLAVVGIVYSCGKKGGSNNHFVIPENVTFFVSFDVKNLLKKASVDKLLDEDFLKNLELNDKDSKLAKKRTKYTLEQIGSAINKDHATVLHSVRTCNNLIETNINFKNKYNDCKNI
jgi:hypothetical protein